MPLLIPLRQFEESTTLKLVGELTPAELGLEGVDELIRTPLSLTYELEASRSAGLLDIRGRLELVLECDCARCLKTFRKPVVFADWELELSLEAEEPTGGPAEAVDLTPYVREDILLELPQRPLCDPGCGGLESPTETPSGEGGSASSTAWAELDRLKLK